jgi:hypothetical protein
MNLELKAYLKDGLIIFEYEELKKQLVEYLKQFEKYELSDYYVAKTHRANLNKFIDALETKRKDIKNLVMRQYTQTFEPQMKELTGMIQDAVNTIDVQIKEVDRKEASKKEYELRKIFEGFDFNLVTFEQILDKRWLNKSISLHEVEEEMQQKIKLIKTDLLLIEEHVDADLKARYLMTLNLQQTLNDYKLEQKFKERIDTTQPIRKKSVEVTMSKVQLEVIAPKNMLIELGNYLREKGYVFTQLTEMANYEE